MRRPGHQLDVLRRSAWINNAHLRAGVRSYVAAVVVALEHSAQPSTTTIIPQECCTTVARGENSLSSEPRMRRRRA